jgi:hypothetical protein
MLHKDYDSKDSGAKIISGHDPKLICLKDELIGGKRPAVK